jgi:hypothetical protein
MRAHNVIITITLRGRPPSVLPLIQVHINYIAA